MQVPRYEYIGRREVADRDFDYKTLKSNCIALHWNSVHHIMQFRESSKGAFIDDCLCSDADADDVEMHYITILQYIILHHNTIHNITIYYITAMH